MVTIAGSIKDIGTSADGYPYVCFNGQSSTSSVLCVFEPGSEQSVSSLAIGRRAEVTGRCDATSMGSSRWEDAHSSLRSLMRF